MMKDHWENTIDKSPREIQIMKTKQRFLLWAEIINFLHDIREQTPWLWTDFLHEELVIRDLMAQAWEHRDQYAEVLQNAGVEWPIVDTWSKDYWSYWGRRPDMYRNQLPYQPLEPGLDYKKAEEETDPIFQYGKISNGDSGIHWKSVGEVFDWTCHICGEKVDRIGGTPNNRRGCTVEHIVPQSKGGANTWNNVRPAHWDCNIYKSANI